LTEILLTTNNLGLMMSPEFPVCACNPPSVPSWGIICLHCNGLMPQQYWNVPKDGKD